MARGGEVSAVLTLYRQEREGKADGWVRRMTGRRQVKQRGRQCPGRDAEWSLSDGLAANSLRWHGDGHDAVHSGRRTVLASWHQGGAGAVVGGRRTKVGGVGAQLVFERKGGE